MAPELEFVTERARAIADLDASLLRVDTSDEPDHDELCKREQAFLLDAILQDRDLSDHMQDAIESLRIVLAADESVRTGRTIDL